MGLLRVILALSVVGAHLGRPFLLEPDVAVRLFFAISGFYMALVLDGKYPATWEGTKAFYANRLLRLYPTYLVTLLGSFAIALVAQGRPGYYNGFFHRYEGTGWLGVGVVLSQALIVGQDALLFLGYGGGHVFATKAFYTLPLAQQAWRLTLVPPAWSLSLEIAFYALAPWLARWRAGVLFALVLASYALRFALRTHLPVVTDPWNYRVFPFEIGTFLLGVLGYRVYRRLGAERWTIKAWIVVSLASTLAFVGMARLPLGLFWSPVFVVAALPVLFAATRRSSIDRTVGELSYPLYLVHYPIYGLMVSLGARHAAGFAVVISVLVSVGIVRWLDVPVDAFRQRLALRAGERARSDSDLIAKDPPPIL